jgi:hypothetical protein
MSRRRTNPGYLSDDEVARERRRTEHVVRRIVHYKKTDFGSKRTKMINLDAGDYKTPSREGVIGKSVECRDVTIQEADNSWFNSRLCDACGGVLQIKHWHCEKCNIHFCFRCGEEISNMQKKVFPYCPMCEKLFGLTAGKS